MEITRIMLLAAFVTAFVLSLIFSPVAIKLAPKIGAMDLEGWTQNAQQAHAAIRLFGYLCGTTASLLIYAGQNERFVSVIIGRTMIYIMGVVDDLKNLDRR